MKRVHIIGGKNHGKTLLIEELLRHYRANGLRVATIKHTHHHHELDAPGKDSHRHREAGACLVGVLSRKMSAVFVPVEEEKGEQATDNSLPGEDRYQSFEPLFADCDLVLVEGDTLATAAKVEVWRAAIGTPPRSGKDSNVQAVITDDTCDHGPTVWPRSDIATVAKNILALVHD
ncbi:MAG: molybdopterin-guanine dinucleotide biosynthesis protein B [Pirellulales bacterium]|nr:molybdopterin-guanine dinucleotide biosynthesis protein B [Pirellulales bacterium]